MALGATVKYLRSHIGSAEAQGAAVDIGAARSFERISVGAAVRNLGPGLQFADQRNEKWSLDYAVLPGGELGRSHRFTFGARW